MERIPAAVTIAAHVVILASACGLAHAQGQATPKVTEAQAVLFAVEIKSGQAWDHAKPAHEQPHFHEHSANLRKLRDQGSLVIGARYSDKGLIILQASSEQEARALMDQDVSIKNQVFVYELHEFKPFYGGTVQARRPRP